jgi:hypothetical protein
MEQPRPVVVNTIEHLDSMRQSIDEVFSLNPKLEEIGSKEKYAEYLTTIFPESTFKEIVWHYSDADFRDEGFKPKQANFDTLNSLKGVYNFTTNREFAKRYGQNAYPVIVDVKNPVEETNTGEYVDDMDSPLSRFMYESGRQTETNQFAPKVDVSKKDRDAFINRISGEEYMKSHPVSGKEIGLPQQVLVSIFDPLQIHILGSSSDIEKFKAFISHDR